MLRVRDALALYLLAVLGLITVGSVLAGVGLLGLAASELGLVALPTVLVARARGDRLGLVRPGGAALAGAALIGASAWAFLAIVVLPIQERIAPTPRGLEESLERATSGATWAVLLAVAALPAVCEELLCRGAIAFALRRRAGPVVAVLVSALLFALLHGSPYRLAPTFLLGIAFGAIALRSGSIVPTMLAHALNNAAIVLVSTAPIVGDAIDAHGALVGGLAVIALTVGFALVFLRSDRVR
jgi:membrane protease YdiL (CAAX protease family)